MVSLSFDDVNKIITIAKPTVSVKVQELYDGIREWEDDLENMDIPKVCDAYGKQALTDTLYVGVTLILYDWKIKFEDRTVGEGWTTCEVVEGNLRTYDSGTTSYVSPIEPASYVTATLSSSASATIKELDTLPADVAESVWNATASDYTVSGSFGELLNFIYNIEGGMWKRDGTTLTFYKDDNSTTVATFNLKTVTGSAAGETDDVYERQRA